MAKKGLDEDRLKFFVGMGEAETAESDKTGSDETKPRLSESDKRESVISESDKTESEEIELRVSESDKSESDKRESVTSESDKTESRVSESDNRRSTNKGRKQAHKIALPKSRAPSTIPKIRAKKVDDSVLDQAILAASKSPKVSIYSPFVAAVVKCNELTTIGYKSSADSRELLEKALEQAYPEVCEKVRRYMENR
jgi:hypothetical protein